jgi:aromatic ring-opening dioxygenase catalytic subunit (LigB family)
MSYHNLRHLHDTTGSSELFDSWLTAAVTAPDPRTREKQLIEWQYAPAAREAHPREEHLLPLMVAAGAASNDMGQKFYSEQLPLWNFRTSAFRFG